MLEWYPSPSITAVEQERRRHPRTALDEDVTVCLRGARDAVIPGRLLEVSTLGFRLRHGSDELVPGQHVCLLYEWGDVPARVVWCRPVADGIETGFELS